MKAPRSGVSSLGSTQTHYQTLGVARTASAQDIRRAYRALARELHPDRHQQSEPSQAKAAARRMSEINAAWSVLSNSSAKELYDLELNLAAARAGGTVSSASDAAPRAPQPRSASGSTETYTRYGGFDGEPLRYGPADGGGHAVVRGVLWALVLGVLAAIFVFTAYAAQGGNGSGDTGPSTTTVTAPRVSAGACVDESVGSMDLVNCAAPHDARVVEVVPIGRPCPANAREVYLPDQQESACLAAG